MSDCEHYVQFYRADEPLLNRNVSQYLWEGLLRGDALLVLATPEREKSVRANLQRLGVDVGMALSERQLLFLDAAQTIATFTVDGQPDAALFQAAIGNALGVVKPRAHDAGVRAYGEMVGILWEAGQYAAAIKLEEYWNELLEARAITLFCGYPIDVFGKDMDNTHLQALLAAHSHRLPSTVQHQLNQAVHQALDEIAGENAERAGVSSMPTGEAALLWLRENLPERAEGILACARDYYRAAASVA